MPQALAAPRWDRNRVLFEIEHAGRLVACAISREALQDASDRRYAKPQELLACFERSRERIEAVALEKLRARSDENDSLLIIWSDDLDDPGED